MPMCIAGTGVRAKTADLVRERQNGIQELKKELPHALCSSSFVLLRKTQPSSSTVLPVTGSGMPSRARMMAMRIYTPLCT